MSGKTRCTRVRWSGKRLVELVDKVAVVFQIDPANKNFNFEFATDQVMLHAFVPASQLSCGHVALLYM